LKSVYATIFYQLIHSALIKRSISESRAAAVLADSGHFQHLPVT